MSNIKYNLEAPEYATSAQLENAKIPANHNSKNIHSRKATEIARTAMKQNVSRRLLLAKRTESLTCVCDITGIVSILEVPNIPFPASKPSQQKIAITAHPLSILENARGLAAAGSSYLQQLDSQVLAGILIVLAEDYSLFRYQPSDSGAQKNAILRTVDKLVLIDAILLCEDYIHSKNHNYLPKLSLIMDKDMVQGALNGRMIAWLKLVAELIYKNDTREDEDSFYNEVPHKSIKPQYIKDKQKADKAANWAERQATWKIQREFKEDKKAAKELISSFAKSTSISLKLQNMLKAVFQDDTLLTLAPELKALLCNKLSEYTQLQAASLVALIKKDRSALMGEIMNLEEESDPLADDTGLIADSPVVPISPVSTNNTLDEDTEEIEEKKEVPAGTVEVNVDNVIFYVPETEWASKTLFERLLHKKALKKEFPELFVSNNEKAE